MTVCQEAGALTALTLTGSWRRWRPNPENADWPREILQRLLTEILEGEVEAARGVFLNARRDADTAGLGKAFEPRGDINAIAKYVAVLDDDVALVDADAELDAAIRRQRGVTYG